MLKVKSLCKMNASQKALDYLQKLLLIDGENDSKLAYFCYYQKAKLLLHSSKPQDLKAALINLNNAQLQLDQSEDSHFQNGDETSTSLQQTDFKYKGNSSNLTLSGEEHIPTSNFKVEETFGQTFEGDVKVLARKFEVYLRMGQGESSKARDELRQTVDACISKGEGRILLRMIEILLLLFRSSESYKSELKAAFEFDEKIGKENKYYEQLTKLKAYYLYSIEKYDQAIELLQTSFSGLQSDSVLSILIEFRYKLKEYEECLNLLDKFKNKKCSRPYSFWKACIYSKRQDHKIVLIECENYLQQNESSSLTSPKLTAKDGSGDNEINKNNVVENFEENIKIYKLQANALFGQQKYVKAIEVATSIIVQLQDSILCNKEISNEKKIKVYGQLKKLYNLRGKSFQKLQRFDEAVQDFTAIIDIEQRGQQETASQQFILRAICFEELGESEKAKEDMQRAKQARSALNHSQLISNQQRQINK